MPNKPRKVGAIPHLSSHKLPKRIIYFDTETTTLPIDTIYSELPLRLGVLSYNEFDVNCRVVKHETIRFTTKTTFIDSILKFANRNTTLYLVAHNIGFDLRVLNLIQEFAERKFISEPPILNERLFIWDVKTPKGKLCLIDTSNYAVNSIRQLGEDLGFGKGTVDFKDVTNEQLFTYCERDVAIIEMFLNSFIQNIYQYKLGSFKLSLASQAMTSYRTKFMTIQPVTHDNIQALQLERKAYHGGKVECYHIGILPDTQEYYYLDINSMYPYIMKEKVVPYSLATLAANLSISLLGVHLLMYYCIGKVKLCTNNPIYGIKRNGKLIFPIGTFYAELHHSELVQALKEGSILEILELCCYHKALIFSDYIDFFYRMKLDADTHKQKELRYIAKLFMNTLYGKFGQEGYYRQLIGTTVAKVVERIGGINAVTGEHYQEFSWFGSVYHEGRIGEAYFSCPAIAGCITAEARMLLSYYVQTAGLCNCYYVDTDSIICNKDGYHKLLPFIHPNELGKLKLEGVSNHLEIFSNKDYEFGQQVKTKGVPHNATRLDSDTWKYDQFQGFKTWLSEGANGNPTTQIRIKRRRSDYNKANVDHTTGRVTPFVLEEA